MGFCGNVLYPDLTSKTFRPVFWLSTSLEHAASQKFCWKECWAIAVLQKKMLASWAFFSAHFWVRFTTRCLERVRAQLGSYATWKTIQGRLHQWPVLCQWHAHLEYWPRDPLVADSGRVVIYVFKMYYEINSLFLFIYRVFLAPGWCLNKAFLQQADCGKMCNPNHCLP